MMPCANLEAARHASPSLPQGEVARERLARFVDDLGGRRLVAVVAPAGSGKSTLLAQYAQRLRNRGTAVGWVNLAPSDDDPEVVLNLLGTALAGALGAKVLGMESETWTVGTIDRILSQVDEEWALVLDDFHHLQNPGTREVVAALTRSLPQSATLMIGSRVSPAVGMSRLRVRDELVEIGGEELAFSRSEMAELLRARYGFEPEPSLLEALDAWTEGWAAGVQLSGLAMRAGREPSVELSGASRAAVTEYLMEEVLVDIPDDLRQFLLDTCVLSVLDASVCSALSGRENGRALLEEIDRRNLFLIRIDQATGRYRYHAVFSDVLQAHVERNWPGRVANLHRVAAHFLADHDEPGEALEHAWHAGDPHLVATIIAEHGITMFEAGEGRRVRGFGQHLPDEILAARPAAAAAMGWVWLQEGDTARMRKVLEVVAGAAGVPEELRGEFDTLTVITASLEGHFADGMELARRATRPARPWAAAGLADAEGVCLMNAGHFEDALDRFQAGEAMMGDNVYGRAYAVPVAAFCEAVQGRIDDAVLLLEGRCSSLQVDRHPRASAVLATALAELHYEQGRFDDAQTVLDHAADLIDDVVWLGLIGTPGLTAARIAAARGDTVGARRILEVTGTEARCRASERIRAHLAWERVRLTLLEGDVARAGRIAEVAPVLAPDAPRWAYPDGLEVRDIGALRLALHQGDAARVLARVEPLGAEARKGGWTWRLVKLLLIKVQALHAMNQTVRAQRILADALEVGLPGGLIRTFLDEGPLVTSLVRKLAHEQFLAVPGDRLARLLSAAGCDDLPPPSLAGMAEALSDREREVIEMVAAGLSNQEIAQRLFVSLNTVKSHLQRVYPKLGVRRRTAAVVAAREHQLIR